MVKNRDIIKDFLNGFTNKTKNLFIENKQGVLILYSYGYHYPLCIKLLDGIFLINQNGYSQTTAKHKALLCYELNSTNFKALQKDIPNNIKLFSTNDLKQILNKEFKTYNQIVEAKI